MGAMNKMGKYNFDEKQGRLEIKLTAYLELDLDNEQQNTNLLQIMRLNKMGIFDKESNDVNLLMEFRGQYWDLWLEFTKDNDDYKNGELIE